jgi:uncharacterized membrane protein
MTAGVDGQRPLSLEATMKKFALVSLLAAAAFALPVPASAEGEAAAGAVTGAAVGAGVGFAVGGPIGAAVGAGVGGTVGGGSGAAEERREYIEEEAPAVRERECVRDSYGNERCTEVRR